MRKSIQTSIERDIDSNTEPELDPYVVEKIIKKRFNARKSQYEYFVKWRGYSAKENTWDLTSNIPDDILEEFERQSAHMHTQQNSKRSTSGYGLRQGVKPPIKSGYIHNS